MSETSDISEPSQLFSDAFIQTASIMAPFHSRELYELNPPKDEYGIGVSNEAKLFLTYPYIADATGYGLGVGSDQMLDMMVNSKLEGVVIADMGMGNSCMMVMMMELGRRFRDFYHRYPEPEEFLSFYSNDNLSDSLRIVSSEFTADEQKILEDVIHSRMKLDIYADKADEDAPLLVHKYLQYKMMQQDYHSWVSSSEALHQVFRTYEKGKVVIANGNWVHPSFLEGIHSFIQRNNSKISVIYESNATFDNQTDSVIVSLPLAENACIIATHGGDPDSEVRPIIANDRYLSSHFISWLYSIQSLQDLRNTISGMYNQYQSNVTDSKRMLNSLVIKGRICDSNKMESGIQELGSDLILIG